MDYSDRKIRSVAVHSIRSGYLDDDERIGGTVFISLSSADGDDQTGPSITIDVVARLSHTSPIADVERALIAAALGVMAQAAKGKPAALHKIMKAADREDGKTSLVEEND